MRCVFRLVSSTTRTARAGPRSASWPCRSAFSSTVAPLPDKLSGPLSCIGAARESSSAGCKAPSVAARFHPSRLQRPVPVMRPAFCFAVPSSASSRRISRIEGLSGRPPSASFRRCSGRRLSFQPPAAAFVMSMSTDAGWSRPLLAATARPLRLVTGAALLNADRSSACVCACRSPSGQAANGRSVARASSDCGASLAAGSVRTVASKTGAASGPESETPALHVGRAPKAVCAKPSAASSCIGAPLAMRALPRACKRSQPRRSCSMRCSAPPAAPRCSCALRSSSGLSPSALKRSSATLSARTSISNGHFSSAGCRSGSLVLFGAMSTSTRPACNSSTTRRNQRPASPRVSVRPLQPTLASVTLASLPGNLI